MVSHIVLTVTDCDILNITIIHQFHSGVWTNVQHHGICMLFFMQEIIICFQWEQLLKPSMTSIMLLMENMTSLSSPPNPVSCIQKRELETETRRKIGKVANLLRFRSGWKVKRADIARRGEVLLEGLSFLVNYEFKVRMIHFSNIEALLQSRKWQEITLLNFSTPWKSVP